MHQRVVLVASYIQKQLYLVRMQEAKSREKILDPLYHLPRLQGNNIVIGAGNYTSSKNAYVKKQARDKLES